MRALRMQCEAAHLFERWYGFVRPDGHVRDYSTLQAVTVT
jgi:hypothetical protein